MTPQADTLLDNPFPGFRAYEEHENNFLLGRSGAVDELLAKLRITKFLAVVGGPCTGKSSLVTGGLLPALKKGLGAQAGTKWRVATMRPEVSPIHNLALALAQQGVIKSNSVEPDYAQNIETDLRESSNGIAHALQNAGFPENEHLLIVVDQFEDIFRLSKNSLMGTSDKSDITTFVNLLIVASRQRDYPISIAMTMRTLYLGNCSNFRGLPEAINQGQYLIPTLKQADFRQMMLSLADLGDIEIEANALNGILSELQDTADQLPAFQYAIYQTVEYWRNQSPDTLDIADYHAIGGVHHAIHQKAEQVFESLSVRQQEICGWLFRTITEHKSDSQDRKRPARIHAIAQIAEVSELEVIEVVAAFGDFLTIINTGFEGHSSQHTYLAQPTQSEEILPHAIVDIQYEALITQWTRLKIWIEAEQQASETYLHLANASELYMLDRTGLYRNPELAIALRWRDAESPNTEWAKRYGGNFVQSMNFLQESHDRHVLEESQKEEEQTNKLKRSRRITLIFVGLGIISLILSFFAVMESNNAKKAGDRAELERIKAVSSDSVAQVKQKEAELAALDALKAKELADTAKVRALEAKKIAEVQKGIAVLNEKKAIANQIIAFEATDAAVKATDIAERAKDAALKSDSITKGLQVVSVKNYLLAESTRLSISAIDEFREGRIDSAKVLAMLGYYINKKMGGPEQRTKSYQSLRQSLYKTTNSSLPPNDELGHADGIVAVSSYKDAGVENFITCGFSNVAIWQPSSYDPIAKKGYQLKKLEAHKMPDNVKGAVFLPNRKSTIAGCSNGKVYEIMNGRLESTPITIHKEPIISITQMGDKVLVFSERKVSVISGNSVKISITEIPISRKAKAIAFTPNLSHMVIGGNGYIAKYRLTSDLAIRDSVIKSVNGREITALDISPNQLYLAVGNYFGNVEVWSMNSLSLASFEDASQGIILKGHQSPISSVKFNGSSTQLATGSYDKTARIWLFKQSKEEPLVLTTDGWVKGLAFCRNDRYLLVVGADKTTHFFETDLDAVGQKLCTAIEKDKSLKKSFQEAYKNYGKSIKEAAVEGVLEVESCLGIK